MTTPGAGLGSGPSESDRRSRSHYSRLRDVELLTLVSVDRDERAFAEFFSRKARPVYSLIQRQIGDKTLSDDAVQDAFISVWRFARSYRPDRGEVDAWLYTIARHAALRSTRGRGLVAGAEPPDQVDSGPTPEETALSEFESFRIHTAVELLPRHERDIIERAYFQGMSQSEIATDLGVPLGTIKTRNRSALRRLADILQRDAADEHGRRW